MINPQRGEVPICVDGVERPMRLTLGALAGLEDALEAGSLVDLVERFEGGSFRSRDILALLWAGLNGGGWDVSLEDLGKSQIEGGPLAAAQTGARLLAATFAEKSP